MFWADRVIDGFESGLRDRVGDGELVVRDEKTASGHPHIGSLLGVAIHDVLARVLRERGLSAQFYYEINDMDPMDGMPSSLDAVAYEEHMGKPLCMIPAPDDSAPNLAEYFGNDFREVITAAGYTPRFYQLSTLYREGKMNDVIRRALEHADVIRRIYKEVSKSEKADDWYPLNVICEECGKVGTTKVTDFDGERVSYTCIPDGVSWAVGCGHTGTVSPFDGNATLPWKVEWPAKFSVMQVALEGAGKDHSTKGGARDVADRIAHEVFEYNPPVNVPYEFFLVGGKKMSSSKGNASTAREVADLLPSHILSLALIGRDINKQKNFDPSGDSIPLLFDQYDMAAAAYWQKENTDTARIFALIHTEKDSALLGERFLPRFSQIAFLVQMPHIDLYEEIATMKGAELTDADRAEIELRERYARMWLDRYADEKFIYTLAETVPAAAETLTSEQQAALDLLADRIADIDIKDGMRLHEFIHEVKSESGLEPQTFFSAIYLLFLGKKNGPKVGLLLGALEKEFVVNRLRRLA